MLFDQREKSYLFFSLFFSLLSLLWKSRVGDLEKSEEWKEKSEEYKKKKPLARLFFLVAEVGFEPHDLRVMSPTSYQAALLRDILFFRLHRYGAGDRGRTGTILSYHGILSPGRLPVPPHRQILLGKSHSVLYIISLMFFIVNPFFAFILNKFLPRFILYHNMAVFDYFYSPPV